MKSRIVLLSVVFVLLASVGLSRPRRSETIAATVASR
jgi:multisubunit Na+/H+ antiporter MnhG subunit